MHNLPFDLLLILDSKGKVIDVNKDARVLLGDVTGKKVFPEDFIKRVKKYGELKTRIADEDFNLLVTMKRFKDFIFLSAKVEIEYPDGFFIADSTGNLIKSNKVLAEILEHEFKSIYEIFARDADRSRIISELMVKGSVRDTVMIKKRNGKIIWVLIDLKKVGDYVIGFVRDVTFQHLSEGIKDIISYLDRSILLGKSVKRVFKDVCKKISNIFGYSSVHIGKLKNKKFVLVISHPRAKMKLSKVKRTKVEKTKDGFIASIPIRWKRRYYGTLSVKSDIDFEDYEIDLLEIIAMQLAVAMMALDRLKKLKEGEEKYRILVEGAPFGIALLVNNHIVHANRRFLEMFEYEHSDIVGKLVNFVFKNFSFESNSFEAIGVRKGKSTFPVEINLTKIRLYGKTFSILFVQDISEKKKMEEEVIEYTEKLEKTIKRLEDNINQFAYLVDRIRNPLAVIKGYTELKDPVYFDKIIQHIEKIEKILNELDEGWTSTERILKEFDNEII